MFSFDDAYILYCVLINNVQSTYKAPTERAMKHVAAMLTLADLYSEKLEMLETRYLADNPA